MKHDPIHHAGPARAFVLFRSGRRLDLLNPRSDGWTDEDLAHNLARISRWGGATRWRQSLSVAQHSLLVLKNREIEEDLTPREALRELLHDASEGLLGWDPIGPLKVHLGEPFRQLEHRLHALVGERYALPSWKAAAYRRHKAADRLAAASEAHRPASSGSTSTRSAPSGAFSRRDRPMSLTPSAPGKPSPSPPRSWSRSGSGSSRSR